MVTFYRAIPDLASFIEQILDQFSSFFAYSVYDRLIIWFGAIALETFIEFFTIFTVLDYNSGNKKEWIVAISASVIFGTTLCVMMHNLEWHIF